MSPPRSTSLAPRDSGVSREQHPECLNPAVISTRLACRTAPATPMPPSTSSPGSRACRCRARRPMLNFALSDPVASPSHALRNSGGEYLIDDVHCQAEPIHLVLHNQSQWSIDVSSLLIPVYVHALMIRPAVGQFVNERCITMKVEDDGLVLCKQ